MRRNAKQSPDRKSSSAETIHLTENQLKVIKEKYLRDAPSVEAWLRTVVHNVSLAEILLHPDAAKWGIYKGVHCTIHNSARGNCKTAKLVLFHEGIYESSERDRNFKRLLDNLETACREVPAARTVVETWEERFYNMIGCFDCLPNSPTLMNAGRELQQLSACYVLPVDDSIEGISSSLAAQSLIQKAGGGTGFSFGRLRPKGDLVKKTRGVASGALSFMSLFDKMTEVVKQGGMRRGANMGILPYWHPEIKDFITMKCQSGNMENFNISVAIDEKFMTAVSNDTEINLMNPRTGEVAGTARAKGLFDMMVECAWKTGDPGYIILDRMNASNSNPTPKLGDIEATNPCGEVPLLPWEPCNLASINLSKFVEGAPLEGSVNFDRLADTVTLAIRFLDDVIEVNNYPLPEIERMAKGNRRVGLGIMGWAECLVKQGIQYDSQKALDFAEELMRFINDKAVSASEDLAGERGVFPFWKNSIYDPKGPHFRGKPKRPRNSARTTIAPTGTIAIAAGLQGSGIEPFYGIAYTRYGAKALEAIKTGRNPEPGDVFYEVNPAFHELAKKNGFFGMEEDELFKKIDKNGRSIRGIKEIPQRIQKLFPTAHDVSFEFHVKMQASFQNHTDNGVSKTVNMPNLATVEDVKRAYQLAYDLGCKGITVYRDGCKAQQVLNLVSLPAKTPRKERSEEPFGVKSEYYQIRTGYGPLHAHINYDEHGPYQVFTNIPPLGTEIAGLASLIGILLSKYFETGGDPIRILKHLNAVKGDRPTGFGENRVNSIAHGIALALRHHLKKTGWITDSMEEQEKGKLELWEAARTLYCPNCYSSNVRYESGCSGPTCLDCGHSECS